MHATNSAFGNRKQSGGDVFVPANGKRELIVAAHEEAIEHSVQQHQALYSVPFPSHAPMEPINATARLADGQAELWVPTQNQSGLVADVARELGLPPAAVVLHTTLAGGGFGRRIENDFALQAVRIARAAGVPVKLIWSREEDLQHDFYRPASAIKLSAGVDAQGLPLALRLDVACESLFDHSRSGAFAADSLPVDSSGLSRSNYRSVPTLLAARKVDVGVPVGFWRAVAHSQNGFAYECFIDELAHAAAADPLAYRQRLLRPEDSRERRVLDTVAQRSAWHTPPRAGRHRGVALVRANGSVVAHVVELSVTNATAAAARRRITIHRITTVVDCGIAVNPGGVRAQMEGGVVFGLTAALMGEITLRNGAVEQSNFHDHPLLTMAQMPALDITIVPSEDKPGGVGEEAVGPLAPALVNALFAATGQRVRELPLVRAGFDLA